MKFTGGLSNIAQQAVTGNSLVAVTSPNGFAIDASDQSSGSDIVSGQTTAGTPIMGSAVVPAGATLAAQVNGGAVQTIANGSFSIQVPAQVGGGSHPIQ